MKISPVLFLSVWIGLSLVNAFEDKTSHWFNKNSTEPNRLLVSYIDRLTSYWGAASVA